MGFVLMLLWHAIVGGLCAYGGRGRLESREELLGPPYLLAMASTALVGGPVAVFFFHFHPAWFFHYLLDPEDSVAFDTYRFVLSVLVLLAVAGFATAGFLAVRRAMIHMLPPYSLAPVVVLGVLAVGFAGVCYARVFFLGDAEQYLAGVARPITGHSVGLVSLVPVISGVVVAQQCARYFKVDNGSRPPLPAR